MGMPGLEAPGRAKRSCGRPWAGHAVHCYLSSGELKSRMLPQLFSFIFTIKDRFSFTFQFKLEFLHDFILPSALKG